MQRRHTVLSSLSFSRYTKTTNETTYTCTWQDMMLQWHMVRPHCIQETKILYLHLAVEFHDSSSSAISWQVQKLFDRKQYLFRFRLYF
jgi:hypothetical protein